MNEKFFEKALGIALILGILLSLSLAGFYSISYLGLWKFLAVALPLFILSFVVYSFDVEEFGDAEEFTKTLEILLLSTIIEAKISVNREYNENHKIGNSMLF